MPKFKPNPSAFRMGGYSYPGISPIKKDIKVYEGSGNQMTVNEKDLGEITEVLNYPPPTNTEHKTS